MRFHWRVLSKGHSGKISVSMCFSMFSSKLGELEHSSGNAEKVIL